MRKKLKIENLKFKIPAGLITFSLLAVLAVNAVLAVTKSPTPTQIPTPTPTPKPKIEYVLPYPGILPGHPLYSLKMLRDRILGFLITDPLKKAEYYLLMADKRINAGIFLANEGKWDLAGTTISKGQNYLEKVFQELDKARAQEKDVSALVGKLSQASLKHEEVLSEVLSRAPDQAKAGLEKAILRAQNGAEKVRVIQEEKLKKIIEKS